MGWLVAGSLNPSDAETKEDFVRHVHVSRINSAPPIAFLINNFLQCVLLCDCSTMRPCLALVGLPCPASLPWPLLSDWTTSLQPPFPLLHFSHLRPTRALRCLRRRHPLTWTWDPWSYTSSRMVCCASLPLSFAFGFDFPFPYPWASCVRFFMLRFLLLVIFSLFASSSYVHTMPSLFVLSSWPDTTSEANANRAANE